MIEKLSEQWSRVERSMRPTVDRGEPEELETILRQVVGVRDVLRKMCQVSVTRTSLREAVREALLPILREHRDELFPELAEIQKRLDAVEAYEAVQGAPASGADRPAGDAPAPDAFRREFFERLAGFEARIEQLAAIEARHQAFEEQTRKLSDALEDRATREELGGLETRIREDLDERAENLSAALEERATREELGGLETRVRGDLEARDEKLGTELREEVARGLAELETRREARLDEMRQKLDEELRSSVMSVEEKVERVRSYLEEIQTSIPETARAAAGDVESRLREEIESMVVQLSERLNEVRELLEKVDREVAPGRTLLESLDTRLERLEKAFNAVSERVEGIDAVTPEIRALGTRFAEIRKQVEDTTRTLETASGDVRLTLGARLDDLRRALEEGINRWEEDQSAMRERLTSMRDSLRDQLVELGHTVARDKGSLWNKLSGKKDSSLKLSAKDFEDLSSKLEGIISGLEIVIARKKDS